MKTIACFSYKGGTGKSTCLANMAKCIARLGKNVALLDTDVDAPGLHYKFNPEGINISKKGGLVKYLNKKIRVNENNNLVICEDDPSDGKNPLEMFSGIIKTPKGCGTIHLIPAGDIRNSEYWDFLENNAWSFLFSSYAWSAGQEPKFRNNFLLKQKTYIQNLSPSPDYLLIDMRAGIVEVNSYLLNNWVDSVACLFYNNDENIDCMAGSLPNIKSIRRNNIPLDVIPVLSRIPKYINPKEKDAAIEKILLDLKIIKNELYILHSDRQTELRERLQFDLFNPPQNCQLSHDYVELFSRLLLTEENQSEFSEHNIKKSLQLLELDREDRPFTLYWSSGTMENPLDGSRNVAFKATTFNLILDRYFYEIRNEYYSKKGDFDFDVAVKSSLRHAGKVSGELFGKSLIEDELTKKGFSKKSDIEKISTWLKFDSGVGFGQFSLLKDYTLNDKGQVEKGTIKLQDNFLTCIHGTGIGEEHGRCELMAGYIEGTLTGLFQQDEFIVTKHVPIRKEKEDANTKSCCFYFERK